MSKLIDISIFVISNYILTEISMLFCCNIIPIEFSTSYYYYYYYAQLFLLLSLPICQI